MVDIQKVADVMGGPKVLGRAIDSLDQLVEAVAEGLPKGCLRNTARRVVADRGEQRRLIYRVVPEATFKRRRERLSPSESERTERLARVVAAAEYVWAAPENARRFLTAPHPELRGKAPLEAAMTELGARQVELILEKIFHGLPA